MGYAKAQLPFGPETMLQRMLRLVGTVCEQRIVVSAKDQPLPSLEPDVVVCHDDRPQRGPLEGLAAGLTVVSQQFSAAFVTSCDAPHLNPDLIRQLQTYLAPDVDIVVPKGPKYYQPLCALYRPTIVPEIQKLLADDRLRPFFLFASVRTREVDVENLRATDPHLLSFQNINQPQDYAQALSDAGFEMDAAIRTSLFDCH